VEQALLPRRLQELGGGEGAEPGGYRVCLQESLDALLKDAKDKFRGYDSCSTPELHAELACRKVRRRRRRRRRRRNRVALPREETIRFMEKI